MEGANFLKNKELVSLSEQQLVDCSTDEGNHGCKGGLMDNAFKYAEKTGMQSEDHYPYTGKSGICKKADGDISKIGSFKDVAPNSPTQLAAALKLGPVSIGVNGADLGFQFYHSGIVKRLCAAQPLDHGVLLVGMGSEKSILGEKTDYWIVKNSWGPKWGEKGYIRLLRDMTTKGPGMCGLQS